MIYLELKNYRCFDEANPARISLGSAFTGLVGPNNSGKSSILRFFYEFRDLFSRVGTNGNFLAALSGGEGFGQARGVVDPHEVFPNWNDRPLEIDITVEPVVSIPGWGTPVTRLVISYDRSFRWTAKIFMASGPFDPNAQNLGFEGDVLRTASVPFADFTVMFAAMRGLTQTCYIGPFRNAINIGTTEDYYDIAVGQSALTRWREFKTGTNNADSEAAHKLTNDIRRIFGFDSLEINTSADGRTLQLFVNGRSYKLHEIGSGFTQFFLTLFNAAAKRPAYILVDEPEMSLHPALQVDFLTTLGSYASEGVLFATHSIGLARATADRIHSVRLGPGGRSEVFVLENTPRLPEFLGEMSFSAYEELGFNSVLLVEGHETKTMQQILRAYRKDHEVVVLPLGSISEAREAELLELRRITPNVRALIDSERPEPNADLDKPRAGFVEACHSVGVECHVLRLRAIENYMSDRAVKIVKGPKYRALDPYELLRDASPSWGKQENWRIAREMTLEELGITDLGEFVSSL